MPVLLNRLIRPCLGPHILIVLLLVEKGTEQDHGCLTPLCCDFFVPSNLTIPIVRYFEAESIPEKIQNISVFPMVTVPKVVATKKRFLLWFCCVWFQCAILLWKKSPYGTPRAFPKCPWTLFLGGNNSLQGLISHEDTGSVRWVFMFGCFVC